MKIKKRELILLSSWLIIIAAVFGDYLIRSTHRKLAELYDEISLTQEKLSRISGIAKQADVINAEYDRVASNFREIKDSDSLLQEISAIAKKLNVNILNVKPGQAKDDGFYKSYSIKIEIQDEMPVLARFLFTLTEELKSIGVERLQVNAKTKGELPKATLQVSAVVFKE